MTIILYGMNLSPPTRAVMIVAEILGLNIENREVNLVTKDHLKPEFAEKNPLRTIPVLEDGDFIIAESHAIIIYLISKYENAKTAELYPSDIKQRAIVHQRLFMNASILFQRGLTVIKAIMYEKAKYIDEKRKSDIVDAYEILEKYLEGNSFVAGEHLTIADISCITTVSSVDSLVPIDEKYINIRKWWNRLKTLDWYVTKNQPGLDDLRDLIHFCLEKNQQL